jgi:hypothetical protein
MAEGPREDSAEGPAQEVSAEPQLVGSHTHLAGSAKRPIAYQLGRLAGSAEEEA